MKILFFSDIHGIQKNVLKLQQVIQKENFDQIIVLGDLYHQYTIEGKNGVFDNEAIYQFLMSNREKIMIIKGNCDNDIKISDVSIHHDITSIQVDKMRFYLTHGDTYHYDSDFHQKGILIYGHEHIPYIRRKNNTIYICVGSISLPRNEIGATYMIYHNKKFTIYTIDDKIVDEYIIKEEIR